jgi:hypothetical protein
VSQGASATGVARNDATERARVASAEVERGILTGGSRRSLEPGQRHARASRHLADGRVDVADLVEAP